MFKENDLVKLTNSSLHGKVIRILKNNNRTTYTLLLDNNSKISVEEEKLEKYSTSTSRYINTKLKNDNVSIHYNTINSNFENEIMIRHQTVLEALENVELFLSSALMHNEKRVRIIHGRHGGILRNAVHEYLKNSPLVDTYHLADEYEGSIGVTIVYLK